MALCCQLFFLYLFPCVLGLLAYLSCHGAQALGVSQLGVIWPLSLALVVLVYDLQGCTIAGSMWSAPTGAGGKGDRLNLAALHILLGTFLSRCLS